MKIFGHPLHMILIHFPTALLPMDFVCEALAVYLHNDYLAFAGQVAGVAGVCLGFLAILTGAIDMISVANNKPHLLNKTLLHGGINLLVISGYSFAVYMEWKHYPEIHFDSNALLISKAVLIFLMFFANFIGGKLVIEENILSAENGNYNKKI